MEKLKVKVNGKVYEVEVEFEGHSVRASQPETVSTESKTTSRGNFSSSNLPSEGGIQAPIAGVVKEIKVKPQDMVEENQVVVIIEAMKMNTNVVSEVAGKVKNISVSVGDSVRQNQTLIELD